MNAIPKNSGKFDDYTVKDISQSGYAVGKSLMITIWLSYTQKVELRNT